MLGVGLFGIFKREHSDGFCQTDQFVVIGERNTFGADIVPAESIDPRRHPTEPGVPRAELKHEGCHALRVTLVQPLDQLFHLLGDCTRPQICR